MAILDTCALIDLGKGNARAAAAVRKLESEGEAIGLSSITVFELSVGLPPGLDEKRRKLLEPMRVVKFDGEQAELAAIIYRDLEKKGQHLEPFDCMIAAAALSESESVVTADKAHFGRVADLKIVTY